MIKVLPYNKITGLTVTRGSKRVINGLSLEFLPGQIHVILGPGGSGKTTLLKLLTNQKGLESFEVEGKILQTVDKYIHMTQYIDKPSDSLNNKIKDDESSLYVKQLWGDQNQVVVKRLFDHLDTPMDVLPKELIKLAQFTYSMQKASTSEWLFFDEPEVNTGDYMTNIAAVINSYRKGRIIIVNTHNIEFARLLADRILLLVYGEPKFVGPSEEFFNSEDPMIQNVLKFGI